MLILQHFKDLNLILCTIFELFILLHPLNRNYFQSTFLLCVHVDRIVYDRSGTDAQNCSHSPLDPICESCVVPNFLKKIVTSGHRLEFWTVKLSFHYFIIRISNDNSFLNHVAIFFGLNLNF